jgi:hypothetical protein
VQKLTLAAIAVIALSLPLISVAQAQQSKTHRCRHYYDPASHRCVAFRSDSTWPEGLRRNKTGNGG